MDIRKRLQRIIKSSMIYDYLRKLFILSYVKSYVKIRKSVEFHGSEYGGWYISSNSLSKCSIVYSFGVGKDISFDKSIIKKYGCNVFAFDPTSKAISYIKNQILPKNLQFFEVGISDFNGKEIFFTPKSGNVSFSIYKNLDTNDQDMCKVNKISTIMNRLGHQKIDLLKMDIEGSEYKVIKNLIIENIPINQLVVEFHHKWKKIGLKQTKELIKFMNNNGYEIFYTASNLAEYSFINSKI